MGGIEWFWRRVESNVCPCVVLSLHSVEKVAVACPSYGFEACCCTV